MSIETGPASQTETSSEPKPGIVALSPIAATKKRYNKPILRIHGDFATVTGAVGAGALFDGLAPGKTH